MNLNSKEGLELKQNFLIVGFKILLPYTDL